MNIMNKNSATRVHHLKDDPEKKKKSAMFAPAPQHRLERKEFAWRMSLP
jgi:hypothetical protein